MDVEDAGSEPDSRELAPRPPLQDDLVDLCRRLNKEEAKYVVVGGFAIISFGWARMTNDVDLLVATDPDNFRSVPLEAVAVSRRVVVSLLTEQVRFDGLEQPFPVGSNSGDCFVHEGVALTQESMEKMDWVNRAS